MDEVQDIDRAKRRQDRLERIEVQQVLNDIKETFGTPHGKRILYYILEACSIYSDTATDLHSIYMEKGRRAIGLEILDLVMDADPEIYISILRETANDR